MANKEFDTPEAVETAFYDAFSRMDLDLMSAVWGEDAHVLCIHPGSGLLRGRSAVMESWMEIFSGNVPPVVEHRFVDGFAAGNLAVRLVEELIRPRDKSPEAANRVLATNVYVRDARSWRLAEHHASLPLVERGTAAAERRLH